MQDSRRGPSRAGCAARPLTGRPLLLALLPHRGKQKRYFRHPIAPCHRPNFASYTASGEYQGQARPPCGVIVGSAPHAQP
jgi:hypothetical protein